MATSKTAPTVTKEVSFRLGEEKEFKVEMIFME